MTGYDATHRAVLNLPNDDLYIGANQGGCTGTLTMNDYTTLTVSGIHMGDQAANASGLLTVSATSTVSVGGGWFSVGEGLGSGTVTTSGIMTVNSPLFIGRSGGKGWFNLEGGILTTNSEPIRLGEGEPGNPDWEANNYGELNLDGGVLVTPSIMAGYGSDAYTHGVINFNGTTVKPNTSGEFLNANGSTQFFAYVKDGGAIFDTGGYNIGISVPLQAGGTGGVTKLGLGNLSLEAANTYTGPTVVQAGQLTLANANPFAAGTPNEISVWTGATLGSSLGGGSASVAANANVTFSDKSYLSVASDGMNFSTLQIKQLSAALSDFDRVVVLFPGMNLTNGGGTLLSYQSQAPSSRSSFQSSTTSEGATSR